MRAVSQAGLLEIFRTPATPAEAALATGTDEGIMTAPGGVLCEINLLVPVKEGRFMAMQYSLACVSHSFAYSQDTSLARCADTMVRPAGRLPDFF